jgi:hypothetical protein
VISPFDSNLSLFLSTRRITSFSLRIYWIFNLTAGRYREKPKKKIINRRHTQTHADHDSRKDAKDAKVGKDILTADSRRLTQIGIRAFHRRDAEGAEN